MPIFSVVAVIICCVGILGLSALSTIQRTKEIGIRKILGANALNIIFLLFKQYFLLIAIAFALATPIAYLFIHQWLSGFAYRISLHWFLFLVPGFVMFSFTLLMVGGQSLKTALDNPVNALKRE